MPRELPGWAIQTVAWLRAHDRCVEYRVTVSGSVYFWDPDGACYRLHSSGLIERTNTLDKEMTNGGR